MERDFSFEFTETDPVPFQIEEPEAFNISGEPKLKTVYFDAQALTISFDGDGLFCHQLRHHDARFVASIELTDGGAIILAAPDYEKDIPSHYYTEHVNRCDHCGHNRARRRFFLVEKDGKLMQVGSSCVKEFLGINPAHMLRAFESFNFFASQGEVSDEENFLGGGSSGGFGHGVEQVAETANHVIDVDKGYIKGETWNRVWDLMYPPRCYNAYERQKYAEFRAKYDDAEVEFDFEDFKKFVNEMNPNNYTNNLKVIVNSTHVSKRQSFAILVSGVFAYLRDTGKLGPVESNKPKYDILNEWVDAEPKQRLTFNNVRVIGRKLVESFYGDTILYKMLDEKGRPLTWFSSRQVEELDDAYENVKTIGSFTATVKKKDEYEGKKQTLVNRGKVC